MLVKVDQATCAMAEHRMHRRTKSTFTFTTSSISAALSPAYYTWEFLIRRVSDLLLRKPEKIVSRGEVLMFGESHTHVDNATSFPQRVISLEFLMAICGKNFAMSNELVGSCATVLSGEVLTGTKELDAC